MRKLILHSILLLSVFSISSCNYLDVDKWFDDTMKYDTIFSRKEYLERYMCFPMKETFSIVRRQQDR